MGTKVGGGGPPGNLVVLNQQTDLHLSALELQELEQTMRTIRRYLGYETYDLSLFLINDVDMTNYNQQTRGIQAPTDILSFPSLRAVKPGTLEQPQFAYPQYYDLGEILMDVPYIMRVCRDDEQEQEQGPSDPETTKANVSNQEESQSTLPKATPPPPPPSPPDKSKVVDLVKVGTSQSDDNDNKANDNDNDDEDYLYYDDRGVSAAMAKVFDPKLRLHMLLVHGMLHLVGYDHETDDDYKLMVRQEEKLLKYLGLPTAQNPPSNNTILM
ncbi:hypothetical protein ACA910_012417 [Epithemia clementina (nom. ined.)]